MEFEIVCGKWEGQKWNKMEYNKKTFGFGLPNWNAIFGLQNNGKLKISVGSTNYGIRWE